MLTRTQREPEPPDVGRAQRPTPCKLRVELAYLVGYEAGTSRTWRLGGAGRDPTGSHQIGALSCAATFWTSLVVIETHM